MKTNITIIIVISAILIAIIGIPYLIYLMEGRKPIEYKKTELEISVDACLERGGIPIYTFQKQRLKRCDNITQ